MPYLHDDGTVGSFSDHLEMKVVVVVVVVVSKGFAYRVVVSRLVVEL